MIDALCVDGEGLAAVAAESVDRVVPVERDRLVHAEALHDRPARAIDDRELLVREIVVDLGGDLKIGDRGDLDAGPAGADGIDQCLGDVDAETVRGQEPSLNEHMVARQQIPGELAEPLDGSTVMGVAEVGCRVPRRRVDEDAHRPA